MANKYKKFKIIFFLTLIEKKLKLGNKKRSVSIELKINILTSQFLYLCLV